MKPARKQSAPAGKKSKKSADERDLESFRDISDDVIESDFVPYACLYDRDTIATKNGELLQTIKITGLGFEAGQQGDLRGAIRRAIQQCVPDTSYAIWLHTLRRRQQLLPHTHFPDQFSGNLDASWRAQHPSSASFINELYITVVKAGQQAGLRNMEGLLQSLLPRRDRTIRTAFLDNALNELSSTTASMLGQLRQFGARLLTIQERESVFYSEQLEFLEKLINLEERAMPVPRRDLSQELTSGEITFGFNAMEVRTAEGKRRFAAIMTLKEYKEATLKGIDQFLDIPCELIVSQCFDFIGGERAREGYEKQARYLNISGDKELASWMEIDRLMQPGMDTEKAFGEQQTTLFLIAPAVKQLETSIRMVQKSLAKLGMVAIREDLRFEDCYWAQLPGNFPFIARKHSIDSNHLAGFANLQTQPMGNASGSPWGPPVSLLTTVQDTPYFFNFHRGNSAHSIIIGREKSGHTTMAHFLLSQARKLNPNIWYLDATGRAESFMTAMGGKMLAFGSTQLRLNPLQMPESPANREFLAFWLSTLVDPQARNLNQATLGFFQSLVDEMLKLPRDQRRLSTLLPIIRNADAMLAREFQQWCAGGSHGELFDMPDDNFAVGKLIGWNLAPYMKDPALRIPLVSYLLHRLTSFANGEPTLIVMGEGFTMLDTPLFAPRAIGWWDHLSKQNTACMMLATDIENAALLPYTNALAQKAGSMFVLPDHAPTADYAMGFGFTESDIAAIAHMDRAKRHVLLKRGEEATMLKLDLTSLGTDLATLSGRKPTAPEKSAADMLNELMGFGASA